MTAKIMLTLAKRISETRETRDKATKAEMDELRELLGDRVSVAIPECISGPDGYDWDAISKMVYIMVRREDPEYTLEQAEQDTGLHSVRIVVPEIYYYYGEVSSRKKVIEHWDRIFDMVDSFDTCPDCGRSRIPAWMFCGWCGVRLRNPPEIEETPENPTPSMTSSKK